MATIQVILDATDRLTPVLRNTGSTLSSWGSRIRATGTSISMGLTIPLGLAAQALGQLNEAAGKLQIQDSFQRVATQAGLSAEGIMAALRGASAGTISETNLMLAANRAMALGVAKSTDDFVKLMEIARDRARVMGLSTSQAFNDIVTGLGRASPLILDNLGLVVRVGEANEAYARQIGKVSTQLTVKEQKQALVNYVMKQAEETIDRTSLATRTQAEDYAAVRAEMEDTVYTMMRGLLPALNAVLGLFNAMPPAVKTTVIGMGLLGTALGPMLTGLGMLANMAGGTISIFLRLVPVLQLASRAMAVFGAVSRGALLTGGLGILLAGGGALAAWLMSRNRGGGAMAGPSTWQPTFDIDINNPVMQSADDARRFGREVSEQTSRALRGL